MMENDNFTFNLDNAPVSYRSYVIRSGFKCKHVVVEIQGYGKEPTPYTPDEALELTEVFFIDSINEIIDEQTQAKHFNINLKRCR